MSPPSLTWKSLSKMAGKRFLDRTDLSIGGSATVKLDRFVYDPGGSARSVVVSSTKGVLRWVSGDSTSRAYEIRTPHAILGIRGTAFDLIVAPRETVVVLGQGVVSVCARLGPRNCEILSVPGAVAIAGRSGSRERSGANPRSAGR